MSSIILSGHENHLFKSFLKLKLLRESKSKRIISVRQVVSNPQPFTERARREEYDFGSLTACLKL